MAYDPAHSMGITFTVSVVAAESGAEALSLLEKEQPDLILLDILMPGIDGYEVCRRVRANPVTAHLPVIMITASETDQKVKALEAGADDFVIKPFEKAELLARVGSLLRVKRYHDIVQGQAAALAEWNATLEMRVADQVGELERLGHEVGFGVGIAFGFATLGQVGFRARSDYTAVGRVVALATRLCDEASDGEILVSPQVQAAVEHLVESERLPEVTLKGFHKPIAPYNVLGLLETRAIPRPPP